jgi:hypothetical protein
MTENTADAAAFHQALGNFLTRFSEIEALMQRTLWRLAGVGPPTAQALFSGVRLEAAMQYISRIAAAEQWNAHRKAQIQHIFSQLGLINKLRNHILHYGAEPEGPNTWIITNKHFAHVPQNVSRIAISPTTLDDARYDLDKIEYHLIFLVSGTSVRAPDQEEIDAVLGRAWRYKSPPQADDRQTTPDSRQAT